MSRGLMNYVTLMLAAASMPHMPRLRMHNDEHHCAPIRRKRWKRRLRDHSTRVKRCGKGGVAMSDMLTTTLNAIRAHGPCVEGWEALLASLGKTHADDEPLTFEHILDSNGLDDALWALRALPPEDGWMARKYAVRCARRVERLMEDERSRNALEVAERHAQGEATDEELAAAGAAAWAAAWDAAGAAAWAAAGAAAGDAEREWQAEEFRRMCRREGAYESRTAEDQP